MTNAVTPQQKGARTGPESFGAAAFARALRELAAIKEAVVSSAAHAAGVAECAALWARRTDALVPGLVAEVESSVLTALDAPARQLARRFAFDGAELKTAVELYVYWRFYLRRPSQRKLRIVGLIRVNAFENIPVPKEVRVAAECPVCGAQGASTLDGLGFCCGGCNHQPVALCPCAACAARRAELGAALRDLAPDALREVVRNSHRRWFEQEEATAPPAIALERAWLLNATALSTAARAFLQLAPQNDDIESCVRDVAERQLHPKARGDPDRVRAAAWQPRAELLEQGVLYRLKRWPPLPTDALEIASSVLARCVRTDFGQCTAYIAMSFPTSNAAFASDIVAALTRGDADAVAAMLAGAGGFQRIIPGRRGRTRQRLLSLGFHELENGGWGRDFSPQPVETLQLNPYFVSVPTVTAQRATATPASHGLFRSRSEASMFAALSARNPDCIVQANVRLGDVLDLPRVLPGFTAPERSYLRACIVDFALYARDSGSLRAIVELQKGPHHNIDEWRRKDALKRSAAERAGVAFQELFI